MKRKGAAKFASACIMLGLAAASFASTGMVSNALALDITINGNGTSYNGYKVMSAIASGAGEDEKFAYVINPKYQVIFNQYADADTDGDGKVSSSEIYTYIQAMKDDPDEIRKFADGLLIKIKANDNTKTPDAVSVENVFVDVPTGYWLIEDATPDASRPLGETKSLVMLDTLGQEDIEIDVKVGTATLDKAVSDAIEDTNGKASAVGTGDTRTFTLTATLPENWGVFDEYGVVFRDIMPKGLKFKSWEIKYRGTGKEDPPVDVDVSDFFELGGIAIGQTTAADAGTNIYFDSGDMKAWEGGPDIAPGSTLVVSYDVEVTDTMPNVAVNKACLQFSEDPHQWSKYNRTPETDATLFTFDAVFDKVDSAGGALEGAGFTLYESDGTTVVRNEVKGDEMTTFTFNNLAPGTYVLKETTTPDGYNTMEPLSFTITATFDFVDESDELTEAKTLIGANVDTTRTDVSGWTSSVVNSTVSADITNTSGVKLPSTGAAGTVALAVAGTIAVVVGILIGRRKKDR